MASTTLSPEPPAPDAARDELRRVWLQPPGFTNWWAGVNHRTVGKRYIVTAFIFLLIGGIEALVLRLQLAQPDAGVISPAVYNQLFTMHGTTMMFLFAVPMAEGLAMYLIALMIGARDMPFPRLNAFGYFCFLFGGIFLHVSLLVGTVPDGGWFAYVPLTGPGFSPLDNLDYWLLGITLVELSAIAAAVEIVVATLKFRAPGMSLMRMPLFVWNMLVVALMILAAFPALITAGVLLEIDRSYGTHFYNVEMGGDPILWQHLFWIFGHPEVYIQFLPAAGVVSMIVPVFSRRPIFGYVYVAMAAVAIGLLSFGLWVHHMYATAVLPLLSMLIVAGASMMIAIPSGVQFISWIGTMWKGTPVLTTPLLFVAGFIFIFLLGGITGVMIASVPFNLQVHDTFFIVAHFHYVLIGGVVFPIFAGLHYWFPKFTGRMLSERLGRLSFFLMFIGLHVTFFPMHYLGLIGMTRRIFTYEDGLGWGPWNLLATVGAFILAAGVLVFVINFARALRSGPPAGADPWGGGSLEWATDSPPDQYNFPAVLVVRGREPLWEQGEAGLYDYDEREVPVRLEEPYLGQRENVVTSVVEGDFEGVQRLPGNTLIPMWTTLGLTGIFAGVMIGGWFLALSALFTLGAVIAWVWPREAEGEHDRPLPVELPAERWTVEWWGLLSLLFTLAAFYLALLFTYVFLWTNAPEWPLGGLQPPDLLLPAIATALLIGSAPAAFFVSRAGAGRLGLGLSVLGLLGLGFVGAQVLDYIRIDFTHATNTYASLFFAVSGYHLATAIVGLGLIAWALFRARRGHYVRRRRSVSLAIAYWYFVIATWLIVLPLVYLAPHLGPTAEGIRVP